MEPLKTNRLLFTWTGMCAPNESTSKNARNIYAGIATIILVLNVFSFVTTTAFLVVFGLSDLKKTLFAMMCDIAYAALLYALINAFILCKKMNQIFEKLTDICCEGE